MKHLPLFPTLIVTAAAAVMVGLGFWQLDRAGQKEALIARYEAAQRLPPMAFPVVPVKLEDIHFRRATAFCLQVTGWRVMGGGSGGYRRVASCRTGAEGPGLLVDMGVSPNPKARVQWEGGEVTGVIVPGPSEDGFLDRLLGRSMPASPMLVSQAAAQGLRPSPPPSPEDLPNNHLFYAAQWFFFAAAALVIYLLALKRRRKVPA